MRDFRRLKVWQSADALVDVIYRVARELPEDERYGLGSQLKRAAVSIPSNIAEGCGRSSDADFERFLAIAAGSASELEYQLDLSARLWPSLTAGPAAKTANDIKRMLWALVEASRSGRSEV